MSFSDIIKPRKDVLSKNGVEGIIDLENLRDKAGKRLEARPNDFLDLTYPTSDIKYVLQNLHERFSEDKPSAGLYLFEGYKGSGKSHLLLLVYHLLKNPAAAKEWLGRHNLECSLPHDSIVIVHKFTDFQINAIWDLIFQACGISFDTSKKERPDLDDIKSAIKGKNIFLIMDELEMGIRCIANDAIRDQNLAFLQMLTEESARSEEPNITIFASIYDSTKEPGATLKRDLRRIDVKFSDTTDRTKIALHRLFENRDSADRKKIESVLTSYRNEWKRKGFPVTEDYYSRLLNSYPFSPELIQLIQEQARNLFQGTRGALGLLGAMVKSCYRKEDLITVAHASLRERSIKNRLIDLDPGQTIMSCAQSDLDDLRDLPFAEEIVSGVLLATLAASGKTKGMTEETITLQVMKPGDDINEFKSTLQAFHKLGTYFHEQEGVYYFDPEEKPNAKIEYKSLNIDPAKALNKAFEFWTGELFNDREAIVFRDLEQAHAELRLRDKKRPRYVLAPRRLTPEERHDLYFGMANRNLIILLEPRNKEFNALDNRDIIKWAQRYIAGNELQNSVSTVERKRQFERLSREDKDYILRAFKNAGISFIWIQKYGSTAEEDQIEVEQLGNIHSREEVAAKLSRQFFPVQYFEEHLRDRLSGFMGKRLRDVERIYRETLGYPILTHDPRVREALCNLCAHKEIGLRHEKDSACGRKPTLAENEWPEVIIAEPFEDPKAEPAIGLGVRPETPTETEPTTGTGMEEKYPGDEIEPPSTTINLVHVETPFASGVGALRQEVAVKLAEYEDDRIKDVTFRIFFEKKNTDLGSLPAGLRGSMSGLGDITADLTIIKSGDFSKGEVEQMVEGLPAFPDGDYKAEMKVEHAPEETSDEDSHD